MSTMNQPASACISIDLNEYELVPEVVLHSGSLSVRPDGQVTLNEQFLSEIRQHTESLQFRFLIHRQNKNRLLLLLGDTPNYSFRNSGSKKDREFAKSLVKGGVTLPARYNMTWNAELNGWVGDLSAPLTQNALQNSLRSKRRTSK